jgi:hypothetical protein
MRHQLDGLVMVGNLANQAKKKVKTSENQATFASFHQS